MASLTSLALFSLLLTSLCYPAVGQTASCSTSLLGLTSCLGVAAPAPSSACCTSARSANSNKCLCDPDILQAAAQFGATAAAVRDTIASCQIPVDDIALPGTTNCPAVAGVPSAAPADLLATLLAPAPAPLSALANVTAPAPAPILGVNATNVTGIAPGPAVSNASATPVVAGAITTAAPNAAPVPPSAAGSTVVQKLTVVLGLCAVAAAL